MHNHEYRDDAQRQQEQFDCGHNVQTDIAAYFPEVCLCHGETGYHHGERRVHVGYIIHGIQEHGRYLKSEEEEGYSDNGCDKHRRGQSLFHVFERTFLFHKNDAVRPCKQIEHYHVSGQIEYARISEHTSDQRDSDEPAVGIQGMIAFNAVVRPAAGADEQCGDQDTDDMYDSGCNERIQQPAHQLRIILCLIYGDDQAGVYDHEKKVGDRFIPFLADQSDTVTYKCEQHNEEHLHKLLKDKNEHILNSVFYDLFFVICQYQTEVHLPMTADCKCVR